MRDVLSSMCSTAQLRLCADVTLADWMFVSERHTGERCCRDLGGLPGAVRSPDETTALD